MGREALAEAMIPLIGRLYRNNNVVTSIYGRKTDQPVGHRHPQGPPRGPPHREAKSCPSSRRCRCCRPSTRWTLGAVSIDLGRLNQKFIESGSADLEAFLTEELGEKVGQAGATDAEPTDVVLYGFGRIGRLLARILIESGGGYGLRLRAIVVRKGSDNDIVKRA